jgi:hypothetical protein
MSRNSILGILARLYSQAVTKPLGEYFAIEECCIEI